MPITNPWLIIPWQDYENHMQEIGQAQALSQLIQSGLNAFKPQSFALLGCATGNGLEHINPEITKKVYAVDINPEYINQTRLRFQPKIPGLQTLCMDLEKDPLNIDQIDLAFCGLLFEYVDPHKLLPNLNRKLSPQGKIMIVIQQSPNEGFVSKTKYASLKSLKEFGTEPNTLEIHNICQTLGLQLISQKKICMNENKKFISMIYSSEC